MTLANQTNELFNTSINVCSYLVSMYTKVDNC